jgi:hypothetical protein
MNALPGKQRRGPRFFRSLFLSLNLFLRRGLALWNGSHLAGGGLGPAANAPYGPYPASPLIVAPTPSRRPMTANILEPFFQPAKGPGHLSEVGSHPAGKCVTPPKPLLGAEKVHDPSQTTYAETFQG